MKVFSEYFPSFFLFVNGVTYFVIAWLFGSDPDTWFAAVEIQLLSQIGFTELNAMYVGLLSGTGIFLLIAAMLEGLQLGAMVYLLFSYAGLAAFRGWGIFIDQEFNALMMRLFIAETLSLAVTVVALYCLYLRNLRKRNPYY
ncbi:MAG: hypothetical protein WD772_03130 [Pseudohongiellaceae bacterium]